MIAVEPPKYKEWPTCFYLLIYFILFFGIGVHIICSSYFRKTFIHLFCYLFVICLSFFVICCLFSSKSKTIILKTPVERICIYGIQLKGLSNFESGSTARNPSARISTARQKNAICSTEKSMPYVRTYLRSSS